MKTIPELQEFTRLFNEENFFEAHEVLELAWRREKAKGDSADLSFQNFCQGLIQIAASLVHVQKKNLPGARRVFESAVNYLNQVSPQTYGLDLDRLIQAAEKSLDSTQSFPKIN